MERVPVSVVVREWGRIGFIGFGGPPVHVALLRELCVEKRQWIGAREFEDANAACGLLPGPASTQLAIYCARRVGGLSGALAGGLAFILPGLVMLIALAAIALSDQPPAWIRAVGAGAAAVVVAVVVQAGLALAGSSLSGLQGARLARAVAYVAAGAAASVLAGVGVVVVLLGCGLLELAVRRRRPPARPATLGLATLPALVWTALKVGGLSYGGGYVIIPLMQADAVDAYGWMTRSEYVDAVAYGQLTPGPVVQTVAAVGYAAAGLGGALLAAAVAFAPSFLIVLVAGSRFELLRSSPRARAFLDGAGPAAVGAILGAALPLAAGIGELWQYAVLGGAALALARGRPAILALAAGVVAGLVALALGAPLPSD